MGKKLLSMLLVVAMLFSMIPAGYAEDDITIEEIPAEAEDIVIEETPAEAEDIVIEETPAEEPIPAEEPPAELLAEGGEAIPLTLDVEATADLIYQNDIAYFSFTPETSDEYVFTSFSNTDTVCQLYDADWNWLDNDDNSGEDRNFRLRAYLDAGQTYYFAVNTLQGDIASFPVLLTRYFENNFTAWADNYSSVVERGESAELAVLVDGNDLSKVTYQWRVLRTVTHGEGDDAWTSEEYVDIEGAVERSYVTEPVTAKTTYTCLVKDGYFNTQTVYFTVYPDTHFSARPVKETLNVPYGESVTLEVSATSDEPGMITYQWYKHEKYYYDDTNWYWTYSPLEGEIAPALTTAPITEYTQYFCRVGDGYGSSTDIWFSVYIDTHFSAHAVQNEFYVSPGETAALEVSATSDEPGMITYQWCVIERHYYDDGGWWGEELPIEGAVGSSYATDPIMQYTQYFCRVSDGYGRSEDIWFNIHIDTHFSANAVQREFYVSPGETATLEVSATSDEPGMITYQWYRYEEYEENGGWCSREVRLDSEIGRSITTGPISEYTRFFCRVEDGYGGYLDVWFYIYIDTHFSANAVQETFYVSLGETAALEVSATSDEPDKITYEWHFHELRLTETGSTWTDWVVVEGETGPSLTTGPIAGRTDYYCRVSDGYGYSIDIWFNVYINTHFSARPVQETFYVSPGETATLEVSAASDEPGMITYQWYKCEKYYYDDTNWYWTYSPLEGEIAPALTTAPITEYAQYFCRVGDGYGYSTDIWFSIYINTHFSANAVQNEFSVSPGETVTLEVSATSDEPEEITYQWYKYEKYYYDDTNWDWRSSLLEGETGPSLTTGPIAGRTDYYCRVSDGYGYSIDIWFNVYINTHFSANAVQNEFYVSSGETATLEVSATSDEPEKITYEWHFHELRLTETGSTWTNWVVVEGETGPSLTTGPIAGRTEYYCRVSDGYGYSENIWFSIYINTHFRANAVQSEFRVSPGETVTLEVSASSDEPEEITYQWYKYEKYYYDDTNWDWRSSLLEGETGPSLTTAPITEYTEYYCRVSDGYGYSENIWFSIYINTHFRANAVQSEFRVSPGETVTLEVSASSDEPEKITYQWYKLVTHVNEDGGTWTDWEFAEDVTGSSFTTGPISGRAEYYCLVEDGYGGRAQVWFYVYIENHFRVNAVQNYFYLPLGETAALEVTVSGDDTGNVSYTWYKAHKSYYNNESEWYWSYNSSDILAGETGPTLTSAPVTEQQAYICLVEDGYGNSDSVWFYTYVDTKFYVETETQTLYVLPETEVELAVVASSSEPEKISYQWSVYQDYEWVSIDGADQTSFTTDPLTANTQFRCHVEDGYGGYQNVYFRIYMETHFSAHAAQRLVTVPLNSPATLEVVATSDYPDKITYQWDSNGIDATVNGNKLTIESVVGEYWITCYVTDGYGNDTYLYFRIKVDTGFSAYAKKSPLTVAPGAPVTLEVVATANDQSKITYQWYEAEKNQYGPDYYEWSIGDPIEGESGATLSLASVNETKRYYCSVSDGYNDSFWIEFDVLVDSGLRIVSPDLNAEHILYVPYGQTVELEVEATSNYPDKISYEWHRASVEIYSGNYYYSIESEVYATAPSLTTEEIIGPVGYICIVNDGFGSFEEVFFKIFVQTNFSAKAEQEVFYINPGDEVSLNVIAACDEPENLSYYWYEYVLISEGVESYENRYGLEVTTPGITLRGVDRYRKFGCLVSDGCGNTKLVMFYVYIQNHFSAEAVNPINNIGINDTVELKLKLQGDDLDGVTYRWYRYQQMGPNYFYYMQISGAHAESYLATTEYTKYRCIVTDRFGNPITVDFEVNIRVPSGDGYTITVMDYTKGKATVEGIDEDGRFSGEVIFTVSAPNDQAVIVAIKSVAADGAESYAVVPCSTDGNGVHSFTVTVEADITLVLVFRGDADLNGKVNLRDAKAIKGHVADDLDPPLTPIAVLAANANSDRKVNLRDAQFIKAVVAGDEEIAW